MAAVAIHPYFIVLLQRLSKYLHGTVVFVYKSWSGSLCPFPCIGYIHLNYMHACMPRHKETWYSTEVYYQ